LRTSEDEQGTFFCHFLNDYRKILCISSPCYWYWKATVIISEFKSTFYVLE
jgi:hypothetical protein